MFKKDSPTSWPTSLHVRWILVDDYDDCDMMVMRVSCYLKITFCKVRTNPLMVMMIIFLMILMTLLSPIMMATCTTMTMALKSGSSLINLYHHQVLISSPSFSATTTSPKWLDWLVLISDWFWLVSYQNSIQCWLIWESPGTTCRKNLLCRKKCRKKCVWLSPYHTTSSTYFSTKKCNAPAFPKTFIKNGWITPLWRYHTDASPDSPSTSCRNLALSPLPCHRCCWLSATLTLLQ